MSTKSTSRGLVTPTEAESKVAGESGRTLAAHLSDNDLKLAVRNGAGSEDLILPPSAARLLVAMLDELGQGNAIALDTVQPELTTQQAADLLNVSRPHVVKLLDEGVLPSRKVNTHRRVRREDVLNYKRNLDIKRLDTLNELTAYSQDLGLYDPPK